MGHAIKAIFSDLDGTLLRNSREISSYTLAVLKACRDRGILFFPTTARPPRTIRQWFIEGLESDGVICHNGGVALIGEEIVWEQGIAPGIVLDLARRILRKFPTVQLSVEMGGELYANFDGSALWPGVEYHDCDFSSLPSVPSEKLIVGLTIPGLSEALPALLPEGLNMQISENTIAMIQPQGVEKGNALRQMCARLGISPAETVGFGDDWNDVSLLKVCGVGIAVENALPEVKAAADLICLSNEEDGPARWLEENILHSR